MFRPKNDKVYFKTSHSGSLFGDICGKHKVTMRVESQKPTLFGTKRVVQERDVWVDNRTYRTLRKEQTKKSGSRPYSLLEMLLYDELFDD